MNKTQIQVLLIEDNATDAIFLREALQVDALTTFVLTTVERLSSALEVSQKDTFEVILLDLGLPDSQGLETFNRIHQVLPNIPKVILSGFTDEAFAMQAVHAGAQDYLVKGSAGFASAARAIRYAIERQQAQDALRASEERFRAMIENGLDDISLLDADGKLIWESPAVVRNLGYAENEFVGRSFFELIHPDDHAWISGLFAKLIQEPGSRQNGIGRLQHSDGSWRWIEAIVTNMLDNPSVQAVVVNYRDITERKQAEDTIRGLARFPEENPNPIARIGVDGRIMYANSISQQQWLAEWKLSVGDPLPTELKILVEAAIDKNVRQSHDVSVQDRTYAILVVPFRDSGYTNIYGQDITESRRAEEKLHEKASDEALINSLNEAANRGESLAALIKLLGDKFQQLFSAKGTGLYLLSEDGKSLNMPGFALPGGVVGNLEKLIGRPVPPLKIPIRAGGMFQKFLQAEVGTILTDPQEIQTWMTEFTGVETVPAGLEGVISKLRPTIFQILGIRSTISLPLASAGKTIGLLGISSANILGQPELERLRKIGTQLSSAIQRKQDEQRLLESKERFEQLANNIEEAFWITAAKTREEIYLSPATEKIWGMSADALKEPNAFLEHVWAEDRAIVEAALLNQSLGEKTEIEYRIQTPDGTIRWIWDRSFPVFNADGELLSNAGLSTDITEIKETQHELEVLNRTLETRVDKRTAEVQDLYDKAPCGYHSLDKDGIFVKVNQTELDWLGYTRAELVGIKNIHDLITPQSQLVFDASWPRLAERGWINDLEFEMIRKDGGILPVLLNAVAVFDADDTYIQSRSTIFDITERRKVEEALRASEEQLRSANVALEKAARLKDEFMASMSHELRTPLNAILGLSESLSEQTVGPLTEKQQKYVQTINESGRHLLHLINDILDLAKIEAGQIVLDLAKVDLRFVCEASLTMVRHLAFQKNQQIEFQMDEKINWIHADARSLKQMLVNLLSNAIKFTPPGGKLGLIVHSDPAEQRVLLTVWDNGIGIDEGDLKRLFQPFVQLNAGLARENTGTGLGLALVARMARLHGGSVGVVSHPGQGARFNIVLPWEPVSETDAMTKLMITGKFKAIDLNAQNKKTILLVEDTDTVILLIKDFLELSGYKVEVARSGYEAIAQAEQVRPDLILMDVQMPGMDGLEATRIIRNTRAVKHIPIIALTALAMAGDRERCIAAGMNEYISKPINLKAFIKAIQSVLSKAQEVKPV